MSVFINDLSFYQGKIEFAKMRPLVDGSIFRAGQGDYKDSQFIPNWAGAKAQRIPRGSYFFFDNRYPPLTQARLWWELIRNDTGELAHFLDIEGSYALHHIGSARLGENELQTGAYSGWKNWKILLDEFKRLSNGKIKIGIYTGYYSFTSLAPTGGADLDYFNQYPLWIANYGVSAPRLPKPWTTWLFWQYGTTPPLPAREYGVQSSEMDSNRFNGTLDAFSKYFDLNVTPPIPPPASASAWRIKASALNVRTGPGMGYLKVALLLLNDVVEGAMANGWIKITKVTRGGKVITPSSAWYCSGNPLYVEAVAVPMGKIPIELKVGGQTVFTADI